MQACLPRSYLAPVRDEEAESQRKARSRQARQTRRSTQGVTLTELKEAQKVFDQSSSEQHTGETQRPADEPGLERRGGAGECGPEAPSRELVETCAVWDKDVDEFGNLRSRRVVHAESSSTAQTSPTISCSVLQTFSGLNNRSSPRELDQNANERRDNNQSTIDSPSELAIALREWREAREHGRGTRAPYRTQERTGVMSSLYSRTKDLSRARKSLSDSPPSSPSPTAKTSRHDRASRFDSGSGSSSTESAADRMLGRTCSYTRRETRLASLNKPDDEGGSKEYKKMYEDALAENEKLKSRLEDSKQELAKIRTQLEKVTQKQDRISERSSVLETEKREKRVLEKKVSAMEEELKVLTELKSDNQRLKDENGALIRVISKLSK
ncbi:protein phosphatase 1 regulatory subunit 12B-like isoform X1 [Arapaima gigas]